MSLNQGIPGFGALTEHVRRCTVQVEMLGPNPGSGSGVMAGGEGVVITNAHVARHTMARVHLWDGRVVEARLIKKHPRRDLAQLRIDTTTLPMLSFGDSHALRPGHLVVAVGNPLGFQGAASAGVVRAVGPVDGLGSQPWVQASVRLAPGNSGGPLADASGQLVGMLLGVESGAAGRASTAADQLPEAIDHASSNAGELRLPFVRGNHSRLREVTVRL